MLPLTLPLVQHLMRSSLLGASIADPVVPERRPRPRVTRHRGRAVHVLALAWRSS